MTQSLVTWGRGDSDRVPASLPALSDGASSASSAAGHPTKVGCRVDCHACSMSNTFQLRNSGHSARLRLLTQQTSRLDIRCLASFGLARTRSDSPDSRRFVRRTKEESAHRGSELSVASGTSKGGSTKTRLSAFAHVLRRSDRDICVAPGDVRTRMRSTARC